MTFNETMLLEIRRALLELVKAGVKSATISMGTGTQSYTRQDLPTLHAMEADYLSRVAAERRGNFSSLPDFGRVS